MTDRKMEITRWNKQTLAQALGSITNCEHDVLPFFIHNFGWPSKTLEQKTESCFYDGYTVDSLIDFTTNTVVIDSRKINQCTNDAGMGCIFIALPGRQHNGADFAITALKNGASICIVEKVPNNLPPEYKNRIVIVENTHLALIKMAIYARTNTNAAVICITGSCGKTTTKEMVRLALVEIATSGYVHATLGNYNNHYGLPLTLANMPPKTRYAVLELGMNGTGEISILSKIARPDIAIITGIYRAHSEYFANIQDIATAKAEICDGLTHGTLILNSDIDAQCYDILIAKATKHQANIISYGMKKDGAKIDITLDDVKPALGTANIGMDQIKCYESKRITTSMPKDDEYMEITATILNNNQLYRYQIPCIGNHLALNSLAIIGIGLVLENHDQTDPTLDCGKIIPKLLVGLKNFSAIAGRGAAYFGRDNIIIIDESYNANPDSMVAAILRAYEYKKLYNNHRLILILGDMKELGEDAKKMHLDLKDLIIRCKVNLVHAVGEMSGELYQSLKQDMQGFATSSSIEIIDKIKNDLRPNDIFLIKGSNSMNLGTVVKMLKERVGS